LELKYSAGAATYLLPTTFLSCSGAFDAGGTLTAWEVFAGGACFGSGSGGSMPKNVRQKLPFCSVG
jgi:monomeric isocitrate dehydrogenase